MSDRPNVIVLAGPNGAGKSTISQSLLSGALGLVHFVNADTIARGLSAFHVEGMAFKAGKIMLEHLHDLARQRLDFAFETTLATRSFAPWLRELKSDGYRCHLYFVTLPDAEMAVHRVRDRVASGGHEVPADTVRRRYTRGLENFFHLYRELADTWEMVDNSVYMRPKLIARANSIIQTVVDEARWQQLCEEYGK
jgi:predicted ABC-type ATPase